METVACAFIGILQNIFQGWAITFSQSPKVVLLMNCVFPLTLSQSISGFFSAH